MGSSLLGSLPGAEGAVVSDVGYRGAVGETAPCPAPILETQQLLRAFSILFSSQEAMSFDPSYMGHWRTYHAHPTVPPCLGLEHTMRGWILTMLPQPDALTLLWW